MAVRGYTNTILVAQELGRTLSADEEAQATGLIEEAEALIDAETGRAWLVTSPVVDEAHVLVGSSVYLTNTPVVAVTSVTIRSTAIGAVATTLVAGAGYELLDPTTGLITLSSYPLDDVVNGPAYAPGALVRVSYTFASPLPLPTDIRRAATYLVAAWMRGRSTASLTGLDTVSVGQGDLSVKYRANAVTQAGTSLVPTAVQAILRHHRRLAFA